MKFSILICAAAVFAGAGLCSASGQTNATGQAVSVPTPTPGPVGTASTALGTSITSVGVKGGQGSMGTGVNAPASSTTSPIVPGAITVNGNATSLGSGNVAGSVQINNGGAGS